MPSGEIAEGFAGVTADLINPQHPFQQPRDLVEGNPFEDLLSDVRAGAGAAPEHNMITLDPGGSDFDPLQSNVAHVMLRAGIRTACQMNIDRLIQRNALA